MRSRPRSIGRRPSAASFEEQQPAAKQSAKVLSILPRAAELYRRQITLGLDGDPRAALKARVFLREWFGGKIQA